MNSNTAWLSVRITHLPATTCTWSISFNVRILSVPLHNPKLPSPTPILNTMDYKLFMFLFGFSIWYRTWKDQFGGVLVGLVLPHFRKFAIQFMTIILLITCVSLFGTYSSSTFVSTVCYIFSNAFVFLFLPKCSVLSNHYTSIYTCMYFLPSLITICINKIVIIVCI